MDSTSSAGTVHPTLAGHLEICRFDHWFKNVFVLPGIVVAVTVEPRPEWVRLVVDAGVGLVAIGLVASSNYVLNELRDAPFDRFHPTKRVRPVPGGRVHAGLAYMQWIVLGVFGVALGLAVSSAYSAVMGILWVMGCIYNLKPIRSKDRPYLDVLSEAVNNPLRMLAGWFIVGPEAIAPGSLLASYWMAGAYFMAIKRFAEWREIGDPGRAAAYRRSFAYYNESRLLVSVMFYGSASMLFLGAFIMRYRLSLILSFPFVAMVMAIYLQLGLAPNSPVQNPESLYRQRGLMAATVVCAVVMALCLFYEIPILARIFAPTAPTNPAP